MAKNVKASEESKSIPLTQETVDAVMASDPKEGRTSIAVRLNVPAAQIWAVRVVAGMTKVSPEARAYCAARIARAGVVIAVPKTSAPRKTTATAKPKARKTAA